MHKASTYLLFIVFMASSFAAQAQQELPKYVINTDIIYDAEDIPMVGIERFYIKNNHLMSWHVDAEYQFHYNNQFGVIFNQGDVVSIGVYQGPGVKVGFSSYTKWHNRKWINYFSPALGIKYLWYDSLEVRTDEHSWMNDAYRIQSEKALALIPQIYIGQKRAFGSFLFDYYFGLQLPFKFRNKRVYREADNFNVPNFNVPYTTNQVIATPDLVFGIKLGYVKRAKHAKPHDEPEEKNTDENEKDNE